MSRPSDDNRSEQDAPSDGRPPLIVDEAGYEISSTDLCTVCGLLVRADSLVLVDDEWRVLVVCPSEHREAQQ